MSTPPGKKLRSTNELESASSDLLVRVSFRNKRAVIVEKFYPMHYAFLATHSSIVESMPMNHGDEGEGVPIEIVDTDPQDFELAIKVLESPVAARNLTTRDALKLAPFYQKYGFDGGLELCDSVLKDYIKKHPISNFKTPPQDLDLLVDVISESYHIDGLPESAAKGIEYIKSRFDINAIDNNDCLTAIMFSEKHLSKLVPLLKSEEVRGDYQSFVSTFPVDDMGSSNFPYELFVELAIRYSSKRAAPVVTSFCVTGTECGADQTYYGNKVGSIFRSNDDGKCFFSNKKFFQVTRSTSLAGGDWVFLWIDENGAKTVWWKCPHTSNVASVPKDGWVSVNAPTKVELPKIEYSG